LQSVTLHTNLGDLKVELFCEQAPRAAENFLALCASGYYDGTVFHRLIKGFMIQGGARARHRAAAPPHPALLSAAGGRLPPPAERQRRRPRSASLRRLPRAARAGDPTGTGKGGRSIYNTPNGKFGDEIRDELKHAKRGTLSMANSGPNTNGSQFFFSFKPQPHLNGKYTVFGQVIDGLDTLDKMEKVPVDGADRPKQELRIQRVTIHANPLAG